MKISDLTGVSLRWLLTGEGGEGYEVPASHPVLRRVAKLLEGSKNAAEALAGFLDVFSATLEFPKKQSSAPLATFSDDSSKEPGADERGSWIPLLGRSAAGIPQFWSSDDATEGLTALNELISRHCLTSPRQSTQGRALGEGDRDGPVELITLLDPQDGIPEFISAPTLKDSYPDAFAVRIDGESMVPFAAHEDLVVLSPSVPAVDGRAAVVQLKGQIGVTCKIFRRQGDRVHLIPINEQFPPKSYPADDLAWALRVLSRVRKAT